MNTDSIKVKLRHYERTLSRDNKAIVYALSNPETLDVFYVGSTKFPRLRLSQHTKRFGFEPDFTIIEIVNGAYGVNVQTIVERKWIEYYKQIGFTLENKVYNQPC